MHKRLMVCLLLCSTAHAAGLVLVDNGQPRGRIVTRPDAGEMELLAAKELQTYLKRMTGAELPMTSDRAAPGPRVFVGPVDRARLRALRLAEVKWDGFLIKRDRDVLWLVGQHPVGTLNAVYGFLEDQCGVRWFIPTQLGENVPSARTLAIGDLDVVDNPRFPCRRNHGVDTSMRERREGDQWRRRMRITSHSLEVPFNRYSHNLYRVLPTTKYGAAHPEFFPLVKGKRKVPMEGRARFSSWQPCMTHQEVDAIAIAFGRQWLDSHPHTNFYSVGMNDGRGFCECRECRAMDASAEAFRRRSMVSDRYFGFVKRVADRIKRSHPDRYVSCIAYSVVEAMPKQVEIPDNVFVVITQDVCQWHDPEYRKTDMEFAAAWAKAAGAFGTYDYTALSWLMPRVYPHLMAESIKFYDRIGAVAITNEAWPTWWYCAPQLYLRARLMWNATLDADAVLDEFYAGFFGPAATPMKGLFGVFERCTGKPRPGKWFEGLSSVIDQLNLWEPKDVAECRALLAEAKRMAGDKQPHHDRVALVARGFTFADLLLEEYWQAQRVEALASSGAVAGGDVMAAAVRLVNLGERRAAMMDSLVKDRYMWGVYRMTVDRFVGRLRSWRKYLAACRMAGVSRVVNAAAVEDAGRMEELAAKLPKGELADEMRDHFWVIKHPDAPNLAHNPGFERKAPGLADPQGPDWVATNCPPGWSKWSIRPPQLGQLTWEPKAGVEDSACVQIKGCEMACFIQKVPVKPGERHHVSVHVWADASPDAASRLRVRWQDPKGRWLNEHPGSGACLKGKTAGWRKLSLIVKVPPGAGYAVLLPGVSAQQPNDVTRHDNVKTVRLSD